MKTVIDAVNEFGCKFPYADSHYIIHWKGVENNTSFGFDFMPSNMKTNSNWYSVCTYEEFNQCVDEMSKAEWIKPVTEHTFTQEMADTGTLPSVGMECKFDTTFFTTQTSNKGTCEIIAYFGGKVWINVIDIDFVINLNVIEFSPLTPPIELIDGKAYQFNAISKDESVTVNGVYSNSGCVFLSTYGSFPVPTCTNIKLLEVAK